MEADYRGDTEQHRPIRLVTHIRFFVRQVCSLLTNNNNIMIIRVVKCLTICFNMTMFLASENNFYDTRLAKSNAKRIKQHRSPATITVAILLFKNIVMLQLKIGYFKHMCVFQLFKTTIYLSIKITQLIILCLVVVFRKFF